MAITSITFTTPGIPAKYIFMKCTLCLTQLQEKIDDEYYDCPVCRAFVKDTSLYPDEENEKLRYLTHNNDVNDTGYQKFTSPVTNYILDHYLKDHTGLDFGCGTGPVITKMLQESGYQVFQFDPYFANYPENLERTYDYIAACEVVEHFYDPRKEFKKLFDLLNTNGSLVIMTHLFEDSLDFKTWYYRKDPTHVFIYRRETFDYIFKEFGFMECIIEKRLIVLKK